MVNRDQRRFLESVVRSETDASWFIVQADHIEVSEKGVELGVVCGTHEVTFVLSYTAVSLFGFELLQTKHITLFGVTEPDPCATLSECGDHVWRWSAKRRGYYPEVNLCTFCGGVHLPVLTQASIRTILNEAREKGFLPKNEPSPPTRGT